jgi:hypothetical protein
METFYSSSRSQKALSPTTTGEKPTAPVPPSFPQRIDVRAAKQSILREVVDAACSSSFCYLEREEATEQLEQTTVDEKDSLSSNSAHRIRQNLNRKRASWQQRALRGRQEAHNHEKTLKSLKEAAKRAKLIATSEPEVSTLLKQARKKQSDRNIVSTPIQTQEERQLLVVERPAIVPPPPPKPDFSKLRSLPRLRGQRQISDITMSEFGGSSHHHGWSTHHSTCHSIMEVDHHEWEDESGDDDYGFASESVDIDEADANLLEMRSPCGLTRNHAGSPTTTRRLESTISSGYSVESTSLAAPFRDTKDKAQEDPTVDALHRSAASLDIFDELHRRPTSFRNEDSDGIPVSCFNLSSGSSSSTSSRWHCSSSPASSERSGQEQLFAASASMKSFFPVRPPSRTLSAAVPMITDTDSNGNSDNNHGSSSSMQSGLSSPPQLPLRKVSTHGGTFSNGLDEGGGSSHHQYPRVSAVADSAVSVPPVCPPARNEGHGTSTSNNDSTSSVISSSKTSISAETSPRMPLRRASTHSNHWTPDTNHSSSSPAPASPLVEAVPRLPHRKASVQQHQYDTTATPHGASLECPTTGSCSSTRNTGAKSSSIHTASSHTLLSNSTATATPSFYSADS